MDNKCAQFGRLVIGFCTQAGNGMSGGVLLSVANQINLPHGCNWNRPILMNLSRRDQ
jgi:hypothetical protein